MGEAYKPSEEEIQKGKDMMSDDHRRESDTREYVETHFSDNLRAVGSSFHHEVQKPFASLFEKFDRVVETNSALPDSMKGGSPELMRDVETAKRIQLEITEKLKELEGLKFGSTE